MCKVSSFLGCVPLETFGFFFGWFSMIIVIFSGLAICGSTITFIIDRCKLIDRSRAACGCLETIFVLFLDRIGFVICFLLLIALIAIGYACMELIKGVETVSFILCLFAPLLTLPPISARPRPRSEVPVPSNCGHRSHERPDNHHHRFDESAE